MSYIPLGSKVTTAIADTSTLNKGNWTNQFTKQQIGINVAFFECYAVTAVNVPKLVTVDVYVNTRFRSSAVLYGNAEWDPSQPMLLTPGDEVYFAWQVAASGTAPEVTMWFRYDPMVQPVPLGGR
jgi:hypothetical protein